MPLSGTAFAQDGGGGVNITANNCSQIQIIFINQYLNDGDDGTTDGDYDGTTDDDWWDGLREHELRGGSRRDL